MYQRLCALAVGSQGAGVLECGRATLAAHLKQTGVYGSLTLVHVPGLSVYDEEIRLPTGFPSPSPTDTEHVRTEGPHTPP